MSTRIPEIDREVEARVEAMGMELVETEWAGSRRRPILRVRVDFPESRPGAGVTVNDCARVSRELEPWLDEHPLLPEKYVIEVSSPGVERPLFRRRDFVRFRGQEVSVKAAASRDGAAATRLEGVLDGIEEGKDEEQYGVRIRRRSGEMVTIPREHIERAHLLFNWNDEG